MEARGTHDGSEGAGTSASASPSAMLRCGMRLHKSLRPQSVLLSLSSDLVYMTSEQEREQLFFPTRVFPMPAYSFLLPAPLAKALPSAQPPGPSLRVLASTQTAWGLAVCPVGGRGHGHAPVRSWAGESRRRSWELHQEPGGLMPAKVGRKT